MVSEEDLNRLMLYRSFGNFDFCTARRDLGGDRGGGALIHWVGPRS